MNLLQEHYERLSAEQLETERINVEREIEKNSRWATTCSLDDLYRNLNKRDTIVTVLTIRYNGIFDPVIKQSELEKNHMKTIPILTSISIDGTVTISINQVGYTYQIDAVFLPRIEKLFRYKPWTAVNLLRQKAYHYDRTLHNNLLKRKRR